MSKQLNFYIWDAVRNRPRSNKTSHLGLSQTHPITQVVKNRRAPSLSFWANPEHRPGCSGLYSVGIFIQLRYFIQLWYLSSRSIYLAVISIQLWYFYPPMISIQLFLFYPTVRLLLHEFELISNKHLQITQGVNTWYSSALNWMEKKKLN